VKDYRKLAHPFSMIYSADQGMVNEQAIVHTWLAKDPHWRVGLEFEELFERTANEGGEG